MLNFSERFFPTEYYLPDPYWAHSTMFIPNLRRQLCEENLEWLNDLHFDFCYNSGLNPAWIVREFGDYVVGAGRAGR